MDIGSALELVWRDMIELATLDWVGRSALALFMLLPITSLVVALRGNRQAWIPLGMTVLVLVGWFGYYMTTWSKPAGGATVFAIGMAATGAGWVILAVQVSRDWRSVRG